MKKLLNYIWLKKNSKNLISVETKYGNLNLIKKDLYITKSFLNGNYWAINEIKIITDILKFKNKEKLTYFDVGANVGSHVLAISKIFNNKINIKCFEAQPYVYKVLEANIIENKLDNVEYHNCAISNHNNFIIFKKPDYSQINNFGGLELMKILRSDNQNMNFSEKKIKIKSMKLDNFKDHLVDFIKIDVEGMEKIVIEGGLQLIKRNRPTILMELEKIDDKNFLEFFKINNYSGYTNGDGNGLFVPNELATVQNMNRFL